MRTAKNISINKSISFLGLGCVTFGREIDREASFEIMDYAYQKDISFFDTASVYGSGKSESIVGEWLRSRNREASSITVATKIVPPYCSERIEASVDKSLKRLGIDCIDLIYLHQWDPSAGEVETLAALDHLVQRGKVQALGVCNFTAPQLDKVVLLQNRLGFSQFQFVQNNHNFAVSDITEELQQICDRCGIAMVTYSPLGGGFITGKYQRGMPQDSRFSRIPGHQQIYFCEAATKRLRHLHQVAAKIGCSPVQLGLAWAFHHTKVFSVLVGARKKAHIDQALNALAFDSIQVLEELGSL